MIKRDEVVWDLPDAELSREVKRVLAASTYAGPQWRIPHHKAAELLNGKPRYVVEGWVASQWRRLERPLAEKSDERIWRPSPYEKGWDW